METKSLANTVWQAAVPSYLAFLLHPGGISLVGVELNGSLTARDEVEMPPSQYCEGTSHTHTQKEYYHHQRALCSRGTWQLHCHGNTTTLYKHNVVRSMSVDHYSSHHSQCVNDVIHNRLEVERKALHHTRLKEELRN